MSIPDTVLVNMRLFGALDEAAKGQYGRHTYEAMIAGATAATPARLVMTMLAGCFCWWQLVSVPLLHDCEGLDHRGCCLVACLFHNMFAH